MRMTTPHGTELTVFTPKNRTFILIPYTNKAFRDVSTFTLAVDTLPQVFADSGVYALTVSFAGELTATRMCRVRYDGVASG